MSKMNYNNLEEFQDPANYDLEEAENSVQRIAFYADLAQVNGRRALEIACGTGLVALPVAARGIAVTGVDLAWPMLSYAREKARGKGLHIDLIQADARQLPLKKQFPFIYITGNAFQAFLFRADQDRFLVSVKRLLAPDGIFAFETRNPSGHDLRTHDEELWFTYRNIDGQIVNVSGTQRYDPLAQVMHWTTFRRWSNEDRSHTTTTRIACRFTDPQELEALLYHAGIRILHQYGDWGKGSLTAASESIISICQHQ